MKRVPTITIHTERKAEISPYIFMQFMEPLGTADSSVDAGWDYLNECWQPELLRVTKELAPPMLRFGGAFSSYYHWKEAVGPRDGRIPMHNLCWDGMFSNQVGTAEVAEFCRAVGAEPLFVVNMESDGLMRWAYPKPGMDRFGTAEEAAEWVRYCNDPDDALRRSHGAAVPYNVKFWQIGNETSYEADGMRLNDAVRVTERFAKAMKEADPSVELIAWGDSGWAERMCREVDADVPYIAFHHHFRYEEGSPLRGLDYRKDPDETWEHLLRACYALEEHIAHIAEIVSPYGKKIAVTEGHFALPGRNHCEVLSTWAAGVAYARCFHVYQRYADIVKIGTMADFCGNRWQNNAVMIPTPAWDGPAYLQPVGQVMRLYRHHIGKYSTDVSVSDAAAMVDAASSISEDGKTLCLHLANLSRTKAQDLLLETPDGTVREWKAYVIAADPEREITMLEPDLFAPEERAGTGPAFTLPAAGVAAVEIPLTEGAVSE